MRDMGKKLYVEEITSCGGYKDIVLLRLQIAVRDVWGSDMGNIEIQVRNTAIATSGNVVYASPACFWMWLPNAPVEPVVVESEDEAIALYEEWLGGGHE